MVYGFSVDMSVNQWIDGEKKKRMVQGQKKHGPLNLKTDHRDFIQEGIEELVDFLNYWEFAMYQGRVFFCEWNELDEWARIILRALRESRITCSPHGRG